MRFSGNNPLLVKKSANYNMAFVFLKQICYIDRVIITNMKKLYRSKKNKLIAGVIGGIGEFFDVDPTILRLLWILIVIFTGVLPGIVVYIIAALIIPEKEE